MWATHKRDTEKIRAMAVRERDAVARCAARLRAAGLEGVR
jgi:hypothetical protein